MRLLAIVLIAAFAALGTAGAALAQAPAADPTASEVTVDLPKGKSGSSKDSAAGGGGDAAAAPATGTGSASGEATGLEKNVGKLPFTGLDLLIVTGVAMVMLGTGFALFRLSAPRA